jgi:hypothetical protein
MATEFVRVETQRTTLDEVSGTTTVYSLITVHYDDGTSENLPETIVSQSSDDDALINAKLISKSKVEDRRDAVIAGGAPTPSGVVDSDDRSIRNILGLVVMATTALSLGQDFSKSFRFADNSVKVVDAGEMIAIGVASGDFVDRVYQYSWDLKARLDAAISTAEIAAIDIEGNWPNASGI